MLSSHVFWVGLLAGAALVWLLLKFKAKKQG